MKQGLEKKKLKEDLYKKILRNFKKNKFIILDNLIKFFEISNNKN